MIIVNWPFFVSMTILVVLLPFKILQGCYTDNGFMEWVAGRKGTKKGKEKKERKPTRLGLYLKKVFAKDKDLRRPFYVSISFFILFMGYQTLPILLDWNRWQWPMPFAIIGIVIVVILSVFFDTLLMLVANKELFRDRGRKSVFLKSQMIQLGISIIVVSLIIGFMHLHFSDRDDRYIRESVDWVLEPEYEASWPSFREGLTTVIKWGKVGYMDREGQIVIQPKYAFGYDFREGLAAVEYRGKWGYIDKTGQEVIPLIYESAMDFSDGIAAVEKGGIWSVINKQGEVLFETDFQWIGPYTEGVARVRIADKTYPKLERDNLIDREGRLLFTREYDVLGNFAEGCIPAMEKGSQRYYFLDKNEEKVIERGFADANSFSGGMAAVTLEHGMGTAYIDHEGVVLLESGEEWSPFSMSEGLHRFKKGDRYGFKDIYGVEKVPARFRWATDSSEGLIGLYFNGKWGFIENPLPQKAREKDEAFWQNDGLIGNIEGISLYAKEVENQVEKIQKEQQNIGLKTAYSLAFEALKQEKAFEKYGKEVPTEEIQFQLANGYYKKMLLGLPD